jgi:hypothetical protein
MSEKSSESTHGAPQEAPADEQTERRADVPQEELLGDEPGPAMTEHEVLDSDPSGNGPDGLSGGMGTSSERVGPVPSPRGEGTHGAEPTFGDEPAYVSADDEDAPPEQSADPRTGEPKPDNDVAPHEFDPTRNPGHSHG